MCTTREAAGLVQSIAKVSDPQSCLDGLLWFVESNDAPCNLVRLGRSAIPAIGLSLRPSVLGTGKEC